MQHPLRHLVILSAFIAFVAFYISERRWRSHQILVGTTHEELRAHILSLGGQLKNMNISTSAEHGGSRKVIATRNLRPDETIFVIPRSMLLSAKTFSGRFSLVKATNDWFTKSDDFPDMYTDAMVLMYEKLLLNESKWANYFHTLPAKNPLPYTEPLFDTASLAFVPALEEMARGRKEALAAFFPKVVTALQRLPSGPRLLKRFRKSVEAGTWWKYFPRGYDVEGRERASGGVWSYEDALRQLYVHSYACAKTRSVTEYNYHERLLPKFIEQFGVLIPYFDLTNHDSFAFNAEVIEVEGGIGLGAVRPIKRGEEITFSYRSEESEAEADNPGCNWRWLIEYGFVLEDRPSARACYSGNVTASELADIMREHLPEVKASSGSLRRGEPFSLHLNGLGQGGDTLTDWIQDVAKIDYANARLAAYHLVEQRVGQVEGLAYQGQASLAREGALILKGAVESLTSFRNALRPPPKPTHAAAEVDPVDSQPSAKTVDDST